MASPDKKKLASKILKIRFFEESLDPLFEKGVIAGTFHRCIGQEGTAVGVISNVDPVRDFVVSNHRNHGHYLSFTEDYLGLYRELQGRKEGVTGGRGGSQVIFGKNFISNGILGSTVPIATGVSFAMKREKKNGCVVCFVGDGALCEGVVYEAFNMAVLWSLPIVYVIESNHVAQSTPINEILAGDIVKRLEGFNLDVTSLKSTDFSEIQEISKGIIESCRAKSKPGALVIEAQRLCAHSKGDDPRSKEELDLIRKSDPVTLLRSTFLDFSTLESDARKFIDSLVSEISST